LDIKVGMLAFVANRSKTKARRTPKSEAQFTAILRPLQRTCPQCGNPLWSAYNCRRKVVILEGRDFPARTAIGQCHTPCAGYLVYSIKKGVIPTGYATSCMQGIDEVVGDLVESRQGLLALITSSEGRRYLIQIVSL
jgi:hypothetical protein